MKDWIVASPTPMANSQTTRRGSIMAGRDKIQARPQPHYAQTPEPITT